jgi:hypothetical protein
MKRASGNSKKAIGRTTSAQPVDSGGREQSDWRDAMVERIRMLIQQADPEVVEERKWIKATNPSGVPVWSHAGIVCTGETYQQVVKLTFPLGAALDDPDGLFNSSLEGNTRRAIDIREGDRLNANAFRNLIKAAVALNVRSHATKSKTSKSKNPPTSASSKKGSTKKAAGTGLQKGKNGVVLLSGGNPQIAKADGDAPVQQYIAAMPGWKSDLGRRLDNIIVQNVPDVQKAVRWNSPFYGVEGQGWFLSFHVLTRYVKVTFFAGKSLRPIPPGGTPKSGEARWIDIYEDDEFDETQMATWVKQAAALPGWKP